MYDTHINRIASNANKSLGFIERNIKTKHPGVRKAAYKTIVRPQLEYASLVWGPYTQSNIYKVEMVQRRAIRCTLNNFSPHDSVSQMQSRLGWRSLDQRRVDAQLCMLYKIIHGLVAVSLPPYFQQPERMTHHSLPLALRQIHTLVNFYKYSYYHLLLCNGTDYLLTLFFCLHWLSPVRQFDLLTTSYHKHNSPVFNLILTLIHLIVLSLSSTFHLTIAFTFSLHIFFYFSRRAIILPVILGCGSINR